MVAINTVLNAPVCVCVSIYVCMCGGGGRWGMVRR